MSTIERIYIGGLNPTRGLTVEEVASKLCCVKGVEILSINDVAISNNDSNNKALKGVVYNTNDNKKTILDEDGDIVDTRNFFFLEARRSARAQESSSNVETTTTSALDILAKQYNSVKWKGCQLRVENAKPHFLQRLHEERLLASNRKEEQPPLLTNENNVEEQQGTTTTTIEEEEEEEEEGIIIKKCRRRLRIRKRFGEEVYHVDTLPHCIELSSPSHQQQQQYEQQTTSGINTPSHNEDANNNNNTTFNNGSWDNFAFLHNKLQKKRCTQQRKLMERRKNERRLWASGKLGHTKKDRKKNDNGNNDVDNNHTTNDDLNSLIYLNRGIHVRFGDDYNNNVVVDDDNDCGKKDENVVNEEEGEVEAKELMDHTVAVKDGQNNIAAAYSSSSSAVSSSDSDESLMHQKDNGGYNWSDDDDDDDDHNKDKSNDHDTKDNDDMSSEDGTSDDSSDNKEEEGGKYTWSDDDDDDDDASESDGSSTSKQPRNNNNNKKKMVMTGSEYTKAVAIDEFSGGMDFFTSQDASSTSASSENDDNDDSSINSDNNIQEKIEEICCLEDDIKSNINVLSRIFPNYNFDKEPLAPSLSSDDNTQNGTVGGTGGVQHPPLNVSSSLFGGGGTGLIMQRYDPTKESDKKFEVTTLHNDDTDNNAKYPPQEEQGEEESNDMNSTQDKDDAEALPAVIDEKIEKNDSSTNTQQRTLSTNVEEKVIPAKEVYEQDKLEDIFKTARDAKKSNETFSFANMFQTEVEAVDSNNESPKKGDIYEQDKLETVFKEARAGTSGGGGSDGFSFGFQSQLPPVASTAQFSFGFDTVTSDTAKNDNEPDQLNTIDNSKADTPATTQDAKEQPTTQKQSKKRKRRGTRFTESELDKYEDFFFSLNEGPDILNDLEGMRRNEANQETWQRERQVLTADWKRKQKSALSKKSKKVRHR